MKTKEERREIDRQKYLRKKAKETEEQRVERNKKGRVYYNKNKGRILVSCRHYHLKSTYGLSADDYFQKLLKQKNRCAICGNEEHRITKTGDIKPLAVDHNHTTGEVRELLCNDCNALIGYGKENIEVLTNAIQYLKKHQ